MTARRGNGSVRTGVAQRVADFAQRRYERVAGCAPVGTEVERHDFRFVLPAMADEAVAFGADEVCGDAGAQGWVEVFRIVCACGERGAAHQRGIIWPPCRVHRFAAPAGPKAPAPG